MRLDAASEHPAWNEVKDLADKWLIVIFGSPVESHKMYFYFAKPKYGILGLFLF
jgi:hypothetical protein